MLIMETKTNKMKPLLTLLISAMIWTAASAQDTTHVRKSTTTYDSSNVTTPSTTTPTPAPAPKPKQTTADTNHPAPAPVAAPHSDAHFLLGLRFLPTLTALDFNNNHNGTVETSFVLGYGFGGLIGVNFNNHIGMQAEILYSSLAQKYSEGSINREVRLNYVNIPLLLSLNTDYSKPVNLNFVIGPQLGINTGSSISSSGGQGADTVQAVLAVKPGDLGLAYGLGLDFNLGPNSNTKLSIGYRGVFGLIDISDDSNNQTTNSYYILSRSHVRTYAAYLGLTFAL
jgi:hypothetical protein